MTPPFHVAATFLSAIGYGVAYGAWNYHADNRTGGVWLDIAATDNASGPAAGCNATGGFYGPNFTANASGTFHIAYTWNVYWAVFATGPTAATATAKVKVFANLFDLTTRKWAIGKGIPPVTSGKLGWQGRMTTVIVTSGNGTWSQSANPALYVARLTTNLTAGDRYAFYTGVLVVAQVVGYAANSNPNIKVEVGNSGPGAHLRSIVLT